LAFYPLKEYDCECIPTSVFIYLISKSWDIEQHNPNKTKLLKIDSKILYLYNFKRLKY
jgi:hypothetical protein